MSFADLQAAWAGWLVDGLIAGGVERAVISPGSRSTPLVLALARAEDEGRIGCDVVVDERSAAFYALGQARATGRPALVVCTSGTAGAHYLPAAIEAAESRLPILLLTADRPPELRGRGASQTIHQPGLFGRFARAEFDLGTADSSPRAVDGLLRTAILAVHASRWPEPGPVHLNAPFRKPLEPSGVVDADVAQLGERVRNALSAGLGPPDLPRATPTEAALDALARRLRSARRPLIALGPQTPHDAPAGGSVRRLVAAAGCPVIADATSQHRFGAVDPGRLLDPAEPLFASAAFRDRAAPDFVLQVGPPPTGRAFGTWIEGSGVERVVVARHGVPEAFNQAARIVIADLEPVLAGLAGRLETEPPSPDGAWLRALGRAATEARRLADEVAATPGGQGLAVRAAVEALPPGAQLMVGNSMPVRDVDLYPPPGARDLRVLSQRGAAGIDGLIAGAAGAARAYGGPTLLLLGDVSFQHDVGSLAVAARAETPLAIVVVSNGGGRLFELLPVREHATGNAFERFFLTPPGVDVGAACAAFDVRHVRPEDDGALREALREATGRPGATVVEAVVAGDAAGDTARIAASLDAWLTGPEGCLDA